MSYEVIKFIHVLLLVFWLGTDVGVLLLARRFRDASLSVETRLTLLHMAMVIDTLPRICFIVMLPAGVHLANAAGLLSVEVPGLVGLWLLAAVLLTVNMSAAKHIGTPLGARLQRLNWIGLGIAGLLLIATGLASLVNGTPYMVSWLAAKIVIYGLVYWFAIGIDWMFQPVGRLTGELVEKGSSEEIEAGITRTVDQTMWAVLAVYASTLAAAWICVTKIDF
ncbi:MAG: hypothetical protein OXN26_19680 [Gammaproteobacteria bacterium]|nr:hypothetical protein [Gammaproteobacteria bacterium]